MLTFKCKIVRMHAAELRCFGQLVNAFKLCMLFHFKKFKLLRGNACVCMALNFCI